MTPNTGLHSTLSLSGFGTDTNDSSIVVTTSDSENNKSDAANSIQAFLKSKNEIRKAKEEVDFKRTKKILSDYKLDNNELGSNPDPVAHIDVNPSDSHDIYASSTATSTTISKAVSLVTIGETIAELGLSTDDNDMDPVESNVKSKSSKKTPPSQSSQKAHLPSSTTTKSPNQKSLKSNTPQTHASTTPSSPTHPGNIPNPVGTRANKVASTTPSSPNLSGSIPNPVGTRANRLSANTPKNTVPAVSNAIKGKNNGPVTKSNNLTKKDHTDVKKPIISNLTNQRGTPPQTQRNTPKTSTTATPSPSIKTNPITTPSPSINLIKSKINDKNATRNQNNLRKSNNPVLVPAVVEIANKSKPDKSDPDTDKSGHDDKVSVQSSEIQPSDIKSSVDENSIEELKGGNDSSHETATPTEGLNPPVANPDIANSDPTTDNDAINITNNDALNRVNIDANQDTSSTANTPIHPPSTTALPPPDPVRPLLNPNLPAPFVRGNSDDTQIATERTDSMDANSPTDRINTNRDADAETVREFMYYMKNCI